MLNDSHFYDINGGSFYNTAGDAHIYNAIKSSSNNSGIFTNLSQLVVQRSAFHSPDVTRSLGRKFCKKILQLGRKRFGGEDTLAFWRTWRWQVGDCADHCKALQVKHHGMLRAEGPPRCHFFPLCSSSERSTNARLVATLAYEFTLFVPGEKEFTTRTNLDDPAIVPLHSLPGGGFRCSTSRSSLTYWMNASMR